jgi:squalene synthase HpnD
VDKVEPGKAEVTRLDQFALVTAGIRCCIHTPMTDVLSNSDELTGVDPIAHVEAIVRRAGTSFFWAMRRLEEDKRNAMYAIYAFCREVDDIADEPGDVEEKKLALGIWRGEIERLFADRPRNPTACALARPIDQYGLNKEDFRAVIDGMDMDAEPSIRIKNMAELELYCDRVACAVGRLSVRVFGVNDDIGIKLSYAQGQALQLTNILRDIVEDTERDRLYLPRDLLVSHDIDPDDLTALIKHPNLPTVCELLADIAERRFGEAWALASQCKHSDVRPAVMMMAIYHQILKKLVSRGWRNLSSPVKLSKLDKIWAMLRYGIF